jgi:hypothetical protein
MRNGNQNRLLFPLPVLRGRVRVGVGLPVRKESPFAIDDKNPYPCPPPEYRERGKFRRGGFAMIPAIALLGLVAMAITAFCITCSLQSVRSRNLAEEAQLRQLLLAGSQIAQNAIQNSTPLQGPQTLPDSLRSDGYSLSLHVQSASSDRQVIDVAASLPRHQLSQRVEFTRQNGSWQLDSAELEM